MKQFSLLYFVEILGFWVFSRYYFDYDFDSDLGNQNWHMLNMDPFKNTEQHITQ
ncbi:hypothetical protein [Desulfamplus magnetovallimortis]|nr:hypothetical protein [Desulfamplus magnetovallimortis]